MFYLNATFRDARNDILILRKLQITNKEIKIYFKELYFVLVNCIFWAERKKKLFSLQNNTFFFNLNEFVILTKTEKIWIYLEKAQKVALMIYFRKYLTLYEHPY